MNIGGKIENMGVKMARVHWSLAPVIYLMMIAMNPTAAAFQQKRRDAILPCRDV